VTTVMFVGDSITVGLVGFAQGKTSGSSFRGRAGAALGWRAVGPFTDPNGLQHGGVGGSTTHTFETGKAQFVVEPGIDEPAHTWVLHYQPDVIHLMLGVNDILSFHELAKALYDRLMGLAGAAVWQQRRVGKHGYVLLSTMCESLLPTQVVQARLVNDLIRKTREIGSDYQIQGIDSASLFNAAIAAEGVKKYTVDGTHPNQLGYDLIAKSLVNSVTVNKGVTPSSSNSGAKVVAAGGLVLGGWALGRSLKWW
jgi:lysophospholipase L1-like esterase